MEFFLLLSGPFDNPLAYKTLYECLVAVLNIAIYVLFPFIVLMIVYTGFLLVAAQGNPEKLSRAKSALVCSSGRWSSWGARRWHLRQRRR